MTRACKGQAGVCEACKEIKKLQAGYTEDRGREREYK